MGLKGIAVLAHTPGLSLLIHGQDSHPTRVIHHLPEGYAPIGELHLVHAHIHNDPLIPVDTPQGLFGVIHKTAPCLYTANSL